MDVLPLGGSKAKGIEKFIEKKGFRKEHVYAFGDNLNDIEMLQYVGHGVAMGNAPEIVKNAARYITKDVSEDGIAHGLEMVGLLS
ncbi:MAG: HAD-IIB family hydrolase, partial [Sporosarcina sp.]